MARTGTVPVIVKDYKIKNEVKFSPYWNQNYYVLREALEQAKPRPRSPKWHEIEKELAKQIRKGKTTLTPKAGLFHVE